MRYYIFLIVSLTALLILSCLMLTIGLIMPVKFRSNIARIFCHTLGFWLYPWFSGSTINIVGKENLPMDNYIAVSNHNSSLETFVLVSLLRPCSVVFRSSLILIPFFGWCLALSGTIAINRSKPRQAISQILSKGQKKLNRGYNLLLFPEGSRFPTDRIKKLNRSAFKVAKASGYSIVPIVHNSCTGWPPRQKFKKSNITFTIGKPLQCDDINDCTEQVSAWMQEKLINKRIS